MLLPLRIDRYIAGLFLTYFLAGLTVFVTLFVVIDFMSNMVRYSAQAREVMAFYGYFIPQIIHQMTPVACLLGTIFTLASLSRNNELVALFSCGMPISRICVPILALVALTSSLEFFLNDRLGPMMTQKKNYIYFVELTKQPGLFSTVKTNRIWYRSGNTLFNIKTLQAENKRAQGLTMYYFNSAWQLIEILTAQEVSFNGSQWDLEKGSVTLFDFPQGSGASNDVPLTQPYEKKSIKVAEDVSDLQNSGRGTDTLSLAELSKFIQKNKEAGLDTLRYEVEYHSKYAFAFAAVVMSLLGIPFSVAKGRAGGRAVSTGMTMALAFGYWALYSLGLTLGNHGVVPAMIAPWMANVSMLGVGAFLIARLKL